MIFVILGTQKFKFNRLLDKLHELCEARIIQEQIIVQGGYTKYDSNYFEMYDFMDKTKYNTYIKEADLVITHGGTGAIINSIKCHKKVLAFPRIEKYEEHIDNHQSEIVNQFLEKGFILTGEIGNMKEIYEASIDFEPEIYKSETDQIIKIIEDFITKEFN